MQSLHRCGRQFVAVAVLALSAIAAPAFAQEAQPVFAAHIHTGTCDAPGGEAATLTSLAVPAGTAAGTASGVTANAYSTVGASLDALLASPFSIDVHDAASGAVLACGEIGGVLSGGGLTVGLRPTSADGFSGIAYLSPTGDGTQTGISLFIAQTGAAPAGAAAPAPMDAGTYATTVRSQVTLVVGSLQRVDLLFDAPQVNDPAWMSQLNAELALWQMVHGESQEMAPPPEFAAFHQGYVDALALLDSAAADITTGIATGDQVLLSQADQKISEAIAALRALDTPAEATPAATPAV